MGFYSKCPAVILVEHAEERGESKASRAHNRSTSVEHLGILLGYGDRACGSVPRSTGWSIEQGPG